MATQTRAKNCANVCKPKNRLTENEMLVREICDPLVISDDQLNKFMALLLTSIKDALGKKTYGKADVNCSITYINNLPSGKERGKFLSLDFGDPKFFRVVLINIKRENKVIVKSKKYEICECFLSAPIKELIEYVADCLLEFAEEFKILNLPIPLGFSFPFPTTQLSVTKGYLVSWTKGFKCSFAIGNNVVKMLQDAIDKRPELNFIVSVILNEATGNLMACAWTDKNCKISVIAGTGTNASYIEKIENAERYDEPPIPGIVRKQVLINCEWGSFGNSGCLTDFITEFDREIDITSNNPGQQTFEKMISHVYWGELVRLIMAKCTIDGLMFQGKGSNFLFTPNSFLTEYLTAIEDVNVKDPCGLSCILSEIGICNATEEDCRNTKYICKTVYTRSAHLLAAASATLLNKMAKPVITIALDGDMYRLYPNFKCVLQSKLMDLTSCYINYEIVFPVDGSGRGAAILAAVAAEAAAANAAAIAAALAYAAACAEKKALLNEVPKKVVEDPNKPACAMEHKGMGSRKRCTKQTFKPK